MAELALVPQDKSEWFRCRPWIEAALEYTGGTHTIEDIEDGIESGEFQFVCSENSAVVTEFLHYPRMKIFNYFLIGGDLEELVREIEPSLTKWAVEIKGAKLVIGIGRKGFERAFRASGFKPCWTAICKDFR